MPVRYAKRTGRLPGTNSRTETTVSIIGRLGRVATVESVVVLVAVHPIGFDVFVEVDLYRFELFVKIVGQVIDQVREVPAVRADLTLDFDVISPASFPSIASIFSSSDRFSPTIPWSVSSLSLPHAHVRTSFSFRRFQRTPIRRKESPQPIAVNGVGSVDILRYLSNIVNPGRFVRVVQTKIPRIYVIR